MKTVNISRLLFIPLSVAALLAACGKQDYLVDGGRHEARVNLSTYDYLAQHPAGLFDTLITVIDHFGLREEINNAATFFAPTNYSIRRFYQHKWNELRAIDENATYSLDQMLQDIVVDSLRAYIYPDGHFSLASASTQYTPIANASGIEGFRYHKQLQPPGQWSFQPVYYLFYVKVRGEQDGVADDGTVTTPEGDLADLRIRCQTQGIETATGTIINVLANNHTFISDFNPPQEEVEPDWGIVFEYDLAFPYDAANYSGTTVSVNQSQLADALGLSTAEIVSLFGSTIIFYGAESTGELNPNSTANAPGHWFDEEGNVTNWGATARLFSEYNVAGFSFTIGQYPGQTNRGTTYTIRQAMVYNDGVGEPIQVTFIFNVTIE
ncbi:protein of unknown function [Parapedobacter composti]|uniref:DUF4859 domain-containing protein n=1 Tax=Parapedobacter composti TaxID=623281 RepID=A0A1I1E1P8_9SPHI|nr:DUF4859 domain-containing protein [Parapedobacter composti]SFB79138.1 protein of unknown function [Parapedobacter composti]